MNDSLELARVDDTTTTTPIELTAEQLLLVGGGFGPHDNWVTTTTDGPHDNW